MGLWCLALVLLYAQAVSSNVPWPANFTRWGNGQSAVFNGTLFLDGGVVYSNNGTQNFSILASTLIIDITSNWSTSTVVATAIDHPPDSGIASGAWLWAQGDDKLNLWGGYNEVPYDCLPEDFGTVCGNRTWSAGSGAYGVTSFPPPSSLWSLGPLSEGAAATWTNDSADQPPNSVSMPQGSLTALTNTTAFSFGGDLASGVHILTTVPLPGASQQDLSTGQWTNISSVNYGNGITYSIGGEAVHAPMYGKEGVLILFGGLGYTNLGDLQTATDAYKSMGNINVYDIASQTMYLQQAVGIAPVARSSFCAVGASDIQGRGFDIYVFGGEGESTSSTSIDYTNTWVLSLPSFRWTSLKPSSLQNQRIEHTCQLIGGHYMAVLGGIDPAPTNVSQSADQFPNGIGLFNLNTLAWTQNYVVSGTLYTRPDDVTSAIGSSTSPQWAQGVEQLFTNSTNSTTPAQPTTSGTGTPSSKTNIGAIAGGTIGGLLAITLATIAVFLHLRRRKHDPPRKASDPSTDDDIPPDSAVLPKYELHADEKTLPTPARPLRAELRDNPPRELEGENPHDIAAELEGDTFEVAELDGRQLHRAFSFTRFEPK